MQNLKAGDTFAVESNSKMVVQEIRKLSDGGIVVISVSANEEVLGKKSFLS